MSTRAEVWISMTLCWNGGIGLVLCLDGGVGRAVDGDLVCGCGLLGLRGKESLKAV